MKPLKDFLFQGHARSVVVRKNILLSIIYKGINILTQLALVPLTIHYLNKEQYGIWLTLSAIVGWFSFFDIGLGNGLRNKLAEEIAKNNYVLARTYVSTSYAILCIIFLITPFIFFCINPFLEWSHYLNASPAMDSELSNLALITFIFFCLRFIFGLISNILFAVQMAAMNNLITTLGNVLSILLIFLLTFIIKGSLLWVGFIMSAVPVIIFLVISIVLFSKKLNYIKPSLKLIDFKYSKNLLGLGYKFFIIQVAGIILFSSTNIIITQLFGPEEVTSYNIAFRYFSILTMVYGIVLTPIWSAFTEAYVKNENAWIIGTINRLNKVSLVFAGAGVLMIVFCDEIYALWIGGSVKVHKSISVGMGIFVIFNLFASPYNTFINGIGKIKLQYYSAIFSIFATIPLAIFFAKYLGWGTAGIIAATLCTTIPCTFLWKIQFNKIISGKANGVWNK